MKKHFSRLFSIDSIFSIGYAFNVKEGLFSLPGKEKRRSIATVCLLERDVYWQAERHYHNITLLDLPKIMKAELRYIAPFSGHVFWQIKQLTTSKATVIYFALPEEYMALISEKCQFIYPLNDGVSSELPIIEQRLNCKSVNADVARANLDNQVEVVAQKSILNLVGFRVPVPQNKVLVSQRLSFKKLAAICVSSVLAFIILSFAYLSLSLNYYENKVADNAVAVEKALKSQRELRKKSQSKQEFDAFAQENPNVLAILSDMSFDDEKYTIQRIYLHPKGVMITGTSESSATNLLTLLVKHPAVREAKFARALAKNRAGEEMFVIEVVFL